MSIETIFVVHKSDSYYLKYCLNQLHSYNKNINIVLLGDDSNNKYPFAKHYNMNEYLGRSDSFRSNYKHRSSNILEYELFCFERWFILEDFVAKNNITGPFIYFDSDVLVYCNVNEILQWLDQGKRMTVSRTNGPQYSFFSDSSILSEYCSYMLSTQQDKDVCLEWDSVFENWSRDGISGGICDMTVLRMFESKNRNLIADLDEIRGNAVFDHNMNLSDSYVMEHKRKKIIWKDGLPFGVKSESGEQVRFLAMHLQGKAKRAMHRYYTGRNLGLSQLWDTIRLARFR